VCPLFQSSMNWLVIDSKTSFWNWRSPRFAYDIFISNVSLSELEFKVRDLAKMCDDHHSSTEKKKVRGEGSTLIVFCHYFSCHYFHKGGEGRANLTNVTDFMGFLWLQLAAFSLKTTSQKDKIDKHFGEL